MANLNLQTGEAVFTGSGEALSGGADGEMVVVGADDHGSVEMRCAAGETIRAFIGGVEVFVAEVVNGQPKIKFHGPIEAHGFHDVTPPPVASPDR
jgi:hypothetical protein